MAGLPMVLLLALRFCLAVERGFDVLRLRVERCRLCAVDLLACLRVQFVEEVARVAQCVRRVVCGDVVPYRGDLRGEAAPLGVRWVWPS